MDIDFDNPELNQFISRTPTFGVYNKGVLLLFRGDELLVWLQIFNLTLNHLNVGWSK